MHITTSIVIMQVTISVIAMYVTVSSNNFIFLSLTLTFHKIAQKTFKDIISGLHFTTFINIQYLCFPNRHVKGGKILEF